MNLQQEKQLEKAKKYAKSRGGECLSDEYENGRSKLIWHCGNKEHEKFEMSWERTFYNGWCSECNGRSSPEKLIKKVKEYAISKGGQCLSDEYINAKTKLIFECNAGHKWLSDYDHSVNRARWCKKCAYDKSIISNGWQQALEYAKSKNGSVNPPQDGVVKLHTYLTWKCGGCSHEWLGQFRNLVQRHTWCPHCAGKFSTEEYLQKAKEHAESKNGECLSETYIGQRGLLSWKCNLHNFSWSANYQNVVSRDTWCKKCRDIKKFSNRDKFLEKARIHARSKGGKCLSDEYHPNKKLLFQCAKGHKWLSTYGNAIGSLKRWCAKCAGQHSPDEWIARAHKHAKKMGGEFLSKNYETRHKKYSWVCKDNHSFSATIPNIVTQGYWCPDCGNSSYYKENNTRVILEYLLGFDLKKARPVWNKNPKTNSYLELDGYNEKHKFAFEFQGRHHFEENVFKRGNLKDIKYKDKKLS